MVPRPMGDLSLCTLELCVGDVGTAAVGARLALVFSVGGVGSGDLRVSMRLQRGRLRNYPSDRRTLERGDSSLPFHWRVGVLAGKLSLPFRGILPRFPFEGDDFLPSGMIRRRQRRGVGRMALSSARRSGIRKVFPLLLSELRRVGDFGPGLSLRAGRASSTPESWPIAFQPSLW